MSIRFRFNPQKAVEVLLYIAAQRPNVYEALKILCFADKAHLAQYGRFICGDSYVAMSHGPVPSGAYDLIQVARGDGWCHHDISVEEAFTVQGNTIMPRRQADLDWLSESDIECLDAAIQEYGDLSFTELKNRSHDAAYYSADLNDYISPEAIAQGLPDADLLIDYLINN